MMWWSSHQVVISVISHQILVILWLLILSCKATDLSSDFVEQVYLGEKISSLSTTQQSTLENDNKNFTMHFERNHASSSARDVELVPNKTVVSNASGSTFLHDSELTDVDLELEVSTALPSVVDHFTVSQSMAAPEENIFVPGSLKLNNASLQASKATSAASPSDTAELVERTNFTTPVSTDGSTSRARDSSVAAAGEVSSISELHHIRELNRSSQQHEVANGEVDPVFNFSHPSRIEEAAFNKTLHYPTNSSEDSRVIVETRSENSSSALQTPSKLPQVNESSTEDSFPLADSVQNFQSLNGKSSHNVPPMKFDGGRPFFPSHRASSISEHNSTNLYDRSVMRNSSLTETGAVNRSLVSNEVQSDMQSDVGAFHNFSAVDGASSTASGVNSSFVGEDSIAKENPPTPGGIHGTSDPTVESIDSQTDPLGIGAVIGIICGVLGVVVFVGGVFGFLIYHRRFRPLSEIKYPTDNCAYVDDSLRVSYINNHIELPKESSEEMFSLDNDSFLNSLEAMTLQNYWAEDAKNTKV